MPDESFLDDPDTYDAYEEDACPKCDADVGVQAPFWWCDSGHFGVVER